MRPHRYTPTALERAVDGALVQCMHAGLRAALDAALRAGLTRRQILDHARRLTGGPASPEGGLVYLSCEAYLRKKCP